MCDEDKYLEEILKKYAYREDLTDAEFENLFDTKIVMFESPCGEIMRVGIDDFYLYFSGLQSEILDTDDILRYAVIYKGNASDIFFYRERDLLLSVRCSKLNIYKTFRENDSSEIIETLSAPNEDSYIDVRMVVYGRPDMASIVVFIIDNV